MLRSRVFWQLYLSFVLLVVVSNPIVGLLLALQTQHGEMDRAERLLSACARQLSEIDLGALGANAAPMLHERAATLRPLGVRLTLIAADGRVIADSEQDAGMMANHAARPEIVDARKNGRGRSVRHSETLDKEMFYVAVPVRVGGDISGYARAAFSLADIDDRLNHLRLVGLGSAAAGAIVAILAGLVMARRVVSPLARMTQFAKAVANGQYDRRIAVEGTNEFGVLGRALNSMAAQIKADIEGRRAAEAALQTVRLELEKTVEKRTSDLQRANELLTGEIAERQRADAVLTASEERYRDLVENANDLIFTTDLDGNLTSLNRAAERLTGYSRSDAGVSFASLAVPEQRPLIPQMIKRKLEGQARTIYELDIESRSGDRRSLEISSRLVTMAGAPVGIHGIARDITERKLVEAQLRHQALHDSLTGLPNRALFLSLVKTAVERRRRDPRHQFAVLFMDLDRFKVINDSLGHQGGDKMLVAAAERLKAGLRDGDTVARIGGDEFTLLVHCGDGLPDAVRVAARVLEQLSRPFTVEGHEIFATCSIGIALSDADHAHAEDLLRDADIAMYRAKFSGKGCFQVFDREMHVRAANLLTLETDLRRAVERSELELHYQPIVALHSHEVREFEALLRWRHPERGIVPPSEFIPIAEETGLIVPLGRWVLAEACRQWSQWRADGVHDGSLVVSVNLSARQVGDPALVAGIADILEATGVEPRGLNLEITESAIMENGESAREVLSRLKAIGVGLTTDDFGTGYSSLSYLHRFPIDRLKIDRSFVWKLRPSNQNLEIVRTILLLARNLGMEVVAEGIESHEQLEILRDLQCEYGQGYLFSAAVESDRVPALLRGGDACPQVVTRIAS